MNVILSWTEILWNLYQYHPILVLSYTIGAYAPQKIWNYCIMSINFRFPGLIREKNLYRKAGFTEALNRICNTLYFLHSRSCWSDASRGSQTDLKSWPTAFLRCHVEGKIMNANRTVLIVGNHTCLWHQKQMGSILEKRAPRLRFTLRKNPPYAYILEISKYWIMKFYLNQIWLHFVWNNSKSSQC